MDHDVIQAHLAECHISDKTKIDIDLFTSSITKLMAQPFPKKDIVEAFAAFDQMGEGSVSFIELKQNISVIGEQYFTVDEKDTFFEAAQKFAEKE